jgi:hypothetical protein
MIAGGACLQAIENRALAAKVMQRKGLGVKAKGQRWLACAGASVLIVQTWAG